MPVMSGPGRISSGGVSVSSASKKDASILGTVSVMSGEAEDGTSSAVNAASASSDSADGGALSITGGSRAQEAVLP